MTTFKIIFRSGQSNAMTITGADNKVRLLEITNSNEKYFKDAKISLFDCDPTQFTINDTVHIYINDSLEFTGYISRIQQALGGTPVIDIQCIGKTYDLWRFHIPEHTVYESCYSCYIVSSLVASYCSGGGIYVIPPDVTNHEGNYIEKIDVSLMAVGDAIARISKFDGRHFYVDNFGKLHYYEIEPTVQFTVTEGDIIRMTPIEKSDETVINKSLVVGARAYERLMPSRRAESNAGFFVLDSPNKFVAQKFGMPPLRRDILSAVLAKVSISGSEIPDVLKGHIQEEESDLPGSIVPSSDRIAWHGADVPRSIATTYLQHNFIKGLPLEKDKTYFMVFHAPNATSSKFWKIGYIDLIDDTYDFSSEPTIVKNWDLNGIDYGDVWWDDSTDSIKFVAKCRGYASANTYLDYDSERIADVQLDNPAFTDQIEFTISTQIHSYASGAGMGDWLHTDDGRFRPRLRIGLCDYESVTRTMFGIEFDL